MRRKEAGRDLTVFEALILGVVQGATEFLPVSSSGHLVIVPEIFGISAPTLGFDIFVHVATLVAVLAYFYRDVGKIICSVVCPRRMERHEVTMWRRVLLWLVVGSIPAGLVGFLLEDFFVGLFSQTLSVGIFLILTSLLLTGSDFALGRVSKEPVQLNKVRGLDALIIGCFQALAIAPGISRSGATIAGGVFLGLDRPTAARFSFLLSIPAIVGAFIFKLKDISGALAGTSSTAYVVGALAAAISGFVAVFFLMRFLRAHKMRAFAIYTFIVGVFIIILSLA
jgi:undecaprenyl-diphosphatase